MTDNEIIDFLINDEKERKVKVFDYGLMKEFEINDITVDDDKNILLWIDTKKDKDKILGVN